jgi:hypothetical protein
MKAYRGSRGTPPLILDLALDGGEWSTSRPDRFTPEKELQFSLNRRLSGPHSQSGRFGGTSVGI